MLTNKGTLVVHALSPGWDSALPGGIPPEIIGTSSNGFDVVSVAETSVDIIDIVATLL